MATIPNPVPTPWMPASKGGNPNVPAGMIGPSVPGNFIGPIQPIQGGTYMTNAKPEQTPANISQPTQTQQTQNRPAPQKSVNEMGEQEKNAWAIANGYTGWNNYLDNQRSQQGPSQDEINREIDGQYNAQMGYLNQAEKAVNADYTGMQKDAQSQYDTSATVLSGQRQSALGNLDTQARSGQTRKEDAMSAARRLYAELQRGNLQRFGGASSAGQAASEIQGAEAQRQFGQTDRQYNEFTQQIETARNGVENDYKTGLMQLEQTKNAAINQATRDFQQKLLSISQSRAEAEGAKSQARLQALYDLRNKVYAINQQNTQFAQQLEMQKQQAALQLDTYSKQLALQNSNSGNAFNTFKSNTSLQPNTQYNLGGTNFTTGNTPTYVGSINKSVVGKDAQGRTIYQDPTGQITAGWSKYDSFGNLIS